MEPAVTVETATAATGYEAAPTQVIMEQPRLLWQTQNTSSDRENGRNSANIQCRMLLISELTPGQDKWMIKARVTSKSQILSRSKTWHIGTFFKLCLADESGEIEAIAFGNHLVEKYFYIIEVNNVYCLSSLSVQASSKPSLPNSNYELTFNNNTEVVFCKEVPQISYNFVPISEIKNKDKGSFVDIIGICVQTTDFEETVYSNRPYNDIKRYIILKDKSGETVTVILYGLEAEKFNGSNRPIVAIKRGYVGVEKRISVDSLRINPDIEAAGMLREWFNTTQQRV